MVLDELKQKAEQAVETAKDYGQKALNVAENLTGVKEAKQIREDFQQQERKVKGLNYFKEDDGK